MRQVMVISESTVTSSDFCEVRKYFKRRSPGVLLTGSFQFSLRTENLYILREYTFQHATKTFNLASGPSPSRQVKRFTQILDNLLGTIRQLVVVSVLIQLKLQTGINTDQYQRRINRGYACQMYAIYYRHIRLNKWLLLLT